MKPIEIPLSPVTKPRMTQRDRWYHDPDHIDPKKRQRPAVTRYNQFKKDLKELVRGELDPTFDIDFFVPMPKSWSEKKKREHVGKPHQDKPDIDNFLKSFMDAMASDDSYIWDAHPRKFWAYEGKIILTERGQDGQQ